MTNLASKFKIKKKDGEGGGEGGGGERRAVSKTVTYYGSSILIFQVL